MKRRERVIEAGVDLRYGVNAHDRQHPLDESPLGHDHRESQLSVRQALG
jgi:hypothetical protein